MSKYRNNDKINGTHLQLASYESPGGKWTSTVEPSRPSHQKLEHCRDTRDVCDHDVRGTRTWKDQRHSLVVRELVDEGPGELLRQEPRDAHVLPIRPITSHFQLDLCLILLNYCASSFIRFAVSYSSNGILHVFS